ncbi:hypothetical protein HK096_003433 [Nowakowskiella sp. JEL0078]|nr:hypothetical protein HK096_003433 [Nowakowskiella sp. JEL0078]
MKTISSIVVTRTVDLNQFRMSPTERNSMIAEVNQTNIKPPSMNSNLTNQTQLKSIRPTHSTSTTYQYPNQVIKRPRTVNSSTCTV